MALARDYNLGEQEGTGCRLSAGKLAVGCLLRSKRPLRKRNDAGSIPGNKKVWEPESLLKTKNDGINSVGKRGEGFPPEEDRPISWPRLLPPFPGIRNGLKSIFLLLLLLAKPTLFSSKAERRTGFLTRRRRFRHSVITVLLFSTRQ